MRNRLPVLTIIGWSVVAAAGCTEKSSSVSSSPKSPTKELVLYAGRSKALVEGVIKMFEAESGIDVRVKDGSSGDLAVLLADEGADSPADVFWAQDAGSLSLVAGGNLFDVLPQDLLDKVSPSYRSRKGEWIATSGRARVLAYSPARVARDELPSSVFDLTDPKWKGRVGWAPQNASFQAFVTAMRKAAGEEKTRTWLRGMMALHKDKRYPKNTPILRALADAEIDVGLPNHYYLLRFKKDDGDFPVAQTFFRAGDIGNLLNVAGLGILKTSKNRDNAVAFVKFLLSLRAQEYFVNETFEYPVVGDIKGRGDLVDLNELLEAAPKVDLADLTDHQATMDLLREVNAL